MKVWEYIAIAMPYKSYFLSIEQTHDGKFNKFSHELHDIVIRHKYFSILDTFLIICGWRDITETCRQKVLRNSSIISSDVDLWIMDLYCSFRNSIFDAWAVLSDLMDSRDSFRVDQLLLVNLAWVTIYGCTVGHC